MNLQEAILSHQKYLKGDADGIRFSINNLNDTDSLSSKKETSTQKISDKLERS